MRERHEIEGDAKEADRRGATVGTIDYLKLEILLDIRDLLQVQQRSLKKVTDPGEVPAPKVTW